ncbi:MAG: hypothetical protein R3C26_00530 [Calditrichia bacterium]
MGEYLSTPTRAKVGRFRGGKIKEPHTGWTRQFSDRASDSLRLGYQYSENRYFIQSPAGSEPPQETVYEHPIFVQSVAV